MKHIQVFESFKKGYHEKIQQSDFKEIETGKIVQYGGGRHEVIDNDGYILTLKNEDGKLTKVNLNQFNNKGAINESLSFEQKKVEKFLKSIAKEFGYSIQDAARFVKETISKMNLNESVNLNEAKSIEKIEKERSKVVSDMSITVADWKAAKESGDKKAESILLQKLKDLTVKKKNLEAELNVKISDKDKYIELIINEYVEIFENLTAPFEKTANGLAKKIEGWFDWNIEFIDDGGQQKRAEKLNDSIIEWFNTHEPDLKKDAYKILKKLVSTWGLGYVSKLDRFFGSKLNESEENSKTFFEDWQELYEEDFIASYPKVAKLIKLHPNIDESTLSKWWEEIYGGDFKKDYPEMWEKLSKKFN